MTDITIPPEALEAAEDAYHSTPEIGSKAIEAAILAALEAWPGMGIDTHVNIILPPAQGEHQW